MIDARHYLDSMIRDVSRVNFLSRTHLSQRVNGESIVFRDWIEADTLNKVRAQLDEVNDT